MTIDLYYMAASAPCRAVVLTAKVVGVDVTLKHLDLLKGEQMKPEFIAINPKHTVPFIDDNGFRMDESRAICAYLANKYSKNDSLYPKNPKSRAMVDSRLYFDMGVFYEAFSGLYYPIIFGNATSLDPSKKGKLDQALEHLNAFLTESKYAAGDHLTIADFSLLASAATMMAVEQHIFDKYPKIKDWMERCKAEIPDYHALNEDGAETFGKIAQSKLEQIPNEKWIHPLCPNPLNSRRQ